MERVQNGTGDGRKGLSDSLTRTHPAHTLHTRCAYCNPFCTCVCLRSSIWNGSTPICGWRLMGCKSDLYYRSQCWCNRSMRSFHILVLLKSLFIQRSVDLTRWDDMTDGNYTTSFHPLLWSGSCHTVTWSCADQAIGVPVWEPAVKHRPHFNVLYLWGPTFDFGCYSRELAPLSWICPP